MWFTDIQIFVVQLCDKNIYIYIYIHTYTTYSHIYIYRSLGSTIYNTCMWTLSERLASIGCLSDLVGRSHHKNPILPKAAYQPWARFRCLVNKWKTMVNQKICTITMCHKTWRCWLKTDLAIQTKRCDKKRLRQTCSAVNMACVYQNI